MLVSGALLGQRGALFPALQAIGLGAAAVRRALPAVIMGIAADSGRIGGQRLALPRCFVRVSLHDPSGSSLQEALLCQTGRDLAADEVAVLDAGFRLSQVHAAELQNHVTRLPCNFTAHRLVRFFTPELSPSFCECFIRVKGSFS